MLADAFGAAGLFWLVSLGRFGPSWRSQWTAVGVDPIVLAAAFASLWVTALWLANLYRLRARWAIRSELFDIIRAATAVAVVVFSLLFVFKLPNVSRLFLVQLFAAEIIATAFVRIGLRLGFRVLRRHGGSARYLVVVGDGPTAQTFAARVVRHRELGLRIVGYVATAPDTGLVGQLGPRLGWIDDLEDLLHSRVVDEIAICLEPNDAALVEPLTRMCVDEGRIVRIPLRTGAPSLTGGRIEEFDGIPILSLVSGPDRALELLLKRIADLVGAAIGLLILSPVLVLTALWIRRVDGGPILFRQERVGLNLRPFRVLKFRTMATDAEARLEALLEHNVLVGHAFKLDDDPRLTRTGRFLRRTSLDELPQLWNVIRGQMSLVGPRPPLPREVATYDIWHRRRLSMKPGITGLWQVEARREPEFDRWVALDLDYIDHWSLWLDLKIIARTVPAMLGGR
ncbi:MAG TPA: sugar transferase [Candidatus Limnocylindrales bacterium]|nr:sugar transferase [Candidatus Limnocylindrales bacterium]